MANCINNTAINAIIKDDNEYAKGTIKKELKGKEFFESYLKAIGRDKKKTMEKNEVDNAVERLANSFGISSNFMYAILQSLHIKPEDLLDESKEKLIIERLKMYFGVNKKKEEMLNELIKHR